MNAVQPLSPPSPFGCQWIDPASGAKCGKAKILARRLCAKHYRALARSGTLAKLASDPVDIEESVYNADSLTLARDRTSRLAPFAARMLRTAIQVAAERGDSKPAEWLLLHTRAIKPIEKIPPTTLSPLSIKIGVALAGVTATTALVTSASSDPAPSVESPSVVRVTDSLTPPDTD